ncbi:MAG: leucyl aminopeptidase [Frankiales bacterium]|nr:leucyl aminopeptidase [Frankiales bacterium]
MTAIALAAGAAHQIKADAVVIAVAKGADGQLLLAPGAEAVDRALGRRLLATLTGLGATGAAGECHLIPSLGATTAPIVAVAGLGNAPSRRQPYPAEAIRRAAGTAIRSLAGTRRVAVSLPLQGDPDEALRSIAEGALLGAYAYLRYRTTSRVSHKPPVESVIVLVDDPRSKTAKQALSRAEIVAAAVSSARDLVNTPPSDLHPREFADFSAAEAKRVNLDIEILDEKALKKGGYGGIVGVGQGSVNPPRLVRLAYRHPKATKTLALVGKGITFDSGGLSLKPAAPMEWMKSDMGGAAAVLATVNVAARLGLQVNVVGYAPMCENMPSGSAIRPSDVLTMYGGRTVEVLNTDAEGRLVLADAIVRAGEDSPDYLIDVATLTGAQLVALGAHTSAVMGNDDLFRGRVVDAAGRAGEQMWPMPLPPELRRSLDSDVADIANMGDRYGGMLVAGLFLQDFVPEGLAWAHLDIAGPAFNQGNPHGYTPKGGTGAAVRTLVELLEDIATSA